MVEAEITPIKYTVDKPLSCVENLERNENGFRYNQNKNQVQVGGNNNSSMTITAPLPHSNKTPDPGNVSDAPSDVSDLENSPECSAHKKLSDYTKKSKFNGSYKRNIEKGRKYSRERCGVRKSSSYLLGNSSAGVECFDDINNSSQNLSKRERSRLSDGIPQTKKVADSEIVGDNNALSSDDASDVSMEFQYTKDIDQPKSILDVKRHPREIPDALSEKLIWDSTKKNTSKKILRHGKIRFYNVNYETAYMPMVRKVIFQKEKHSCYRNFAKPYSYKQPLFQQIWEDLCHRFAYGYKSCKVSNENQFYNSELIKDSLFHHQKNRLSVAVLGLCYSPEECPEMLWKVGSEVLQSNICGHQFLNSFQNMMRLLCYYESLPEVVMDYACSMLLKQNDVHKAYEVATAVISKPIFSTDIYYNIFYGNLEYVLWKLEWNRFNSTNVNERLKKNWGNDDDEDEEEEESDGEDEHHAKGNAQMAFHGRRAIQYFKKAQETVGIWDLILPKYIEVLTHYDGRQSAIDALFNHMENNPNNPNSYEYYLHYVDQSTTEREILVKVLECYCAVDSTNHWIKELLVLYENSGRYHDLLVLVVKRLDHHACRDSFSDWRLIHKLAAMREESDVIREFFEDNLSCDSSWAKYQFPVPLTNLQQNLSKRVLQLKSKIADCLNIARFSDCVDAWLKSKNLKFKEDIHGPPITFNISLACEHELDVSLDEFVSLSSPEMIYSDEIEIDDGEDLNTSFTHDSSPEKMLPGVLISAYDYDEINHSEINNTFEKKRKFKSAECPSSSHMNISEGKSGETSPRSSDCVEEKLAKKRRCSKNAGNSKRKRESSSSSSSDSSAEENLAALAQKIRVRKKRKCKSVELIVPDFAKEKKGKCRKQLQSTAGKKKKVKVRDKDKDWVPNTMRLPTSLSPVKRRARRVLFTSKVSGGKIV